ncbi:MAG: DoxX family protein [Gammaproteobacteria bacterium]|jgi:putative oxidoreductase|nr:DoxX family protein [Gammaproteobacteria bacterium]
MDRNRLIIPAVGGLYEAGSGLWYPWIRFFSGLFLVPHGAQKLFGWFGGNIDGTAGFFAKIGLEPALPLAYLVGATEFFGGLFVAIGLLTRPAAVAAAVLLLVAAFYVHLGNGYFWNKGGYEYPLLWAILMIGIFFRGGGELSVDQAIGKEF